MDNNGYAATRPPPPVCKSTRNFWQNRFIPLHPVRSMCVSPFPPPPLPAILAFYTSTSLWKNERFPLPARATTLDTPHVYSHWGAVCLYIFVQKHFRLLKEDAMVVFFCSTS